MVFIMLLEIIFHECLSCKHDQVCRVFINAKGQNTVFLVEMFRIKVTVTVTKSLLVIERQRKASISAPVFFKKYILFI